MGFRGAAGRSVQQDTRFETVATTGLVSDLRSIPGRSSSQRRGRSVKSGQRPSARSMQLRPYSVASGTPNRVPVLAKHRFSHRGWLARRQLGTRLTATWLTNFQQQASATAGAPCLTAQHLVGTFHLSWRCTTQHPHTHNPSQTESFLPSSWPTPPTPHPTPTSPSHHFVAASPSCSAAWPPASPPAIDCPPASPPAADGARGGDVAPTPRPPGAHS